MGLLRLMPVKATPVEFLGGSYLVVSNMSLSKRLEGFLPLGVGYLVLMLSPKATPQRATP